MAIAQRHRPQREHHLDLAEEVQQFSGDARPRRAAGGRRGRVVAVLDAVRGLGEARRHERVQHGQQEERRGHGVERIGRDPGRQQVEEAAVGWTGYARGELETGRRRTDASVSGILSPPFA